MLLLADETRSMVEDTAISTYEERLGDYGQLYRTYKRPARMSMKKQFILNFPRYSSSTIKKIVGTYAGRRAGGER
jgi:hypothetical protein